MKLSKNQVVLFFRGNDRGQGGWDLLAAAEGWTHEEAERQRYAMLAGCGFSSLKDVDRLKGFDRVLEAVARLRCELTALRLAEDSPRRVLLRALEEYAMPLRGESYVPSAPFGCAYLGAIMIAEDKHMDVDRLSMERLTQLRDTLAARCSARGLRRGKVAARPTPTLPPAAVPAAADCPF